MNGFHFKILGKRALIKGFHWIHGNKDYLSFHPNSSYFGRNVMFIYISKEFQYNLVRKYTIVLTLQKH